MLVWIAVEAVAEYLQFGLTGRKLRSSTDQKLAQSNTLIRRVAIDPRYLLSGRGYILFVVYGPFSTLHLLLKNKVLRRSVEPTAEGCLLALNFECRLTRKAAAQMRFTSGS